MPPCILALIISAPRRNWRFASRDVFSGSCQRGRSCKPTLQERPVLFMFSALPPVEKDCSYVGEVRARRSINNGDRLLSLQGRGGAGLVCILARCFASGGKCFPANEPDQTEWQSLHIFTLALQKAPPQFICSCLCAWIWGSPGHVRSSFYCLINPTRLFGFERLSGKAQFVGGIDRHTCGFFSFWGGGDTAVNRLRRLCGGPIHLCSRTVLGLVPDLATLQRAPFYNWRIRMPSPEALQVVLDL